MAWLRASGLAGLSLTGSLSPGGLTGAGGPALPVAGSRGCPAVSAAGGRPQVLCTGRRPRRKRPREAAMTQTQKPRAVISAISCRATQSCVVGGAPISRGEHGARLGGTRVIDCREEGRTRLDGHCPLTSCVPGPLLGLGMQGRGGQRKTSTHSERSLGGEALWAMQDEYGASLPRASRTRPRCREPWDGGRQGPGEGKLPAQQSGGRQEGGVGELALTSRRTGQVGDR